ncbi:hypothetical protein NLM33_35190 [Bradyrhizobium sp. CCGUVB1N3]|uniref:hypothetical protein n=1 Tax=Bradyrhizobium sp. CCGUVB1N3 TaxID=2949629 RepID=UPI0020B1F0A6|nr:hypothetical protein [Bradyrhizobium sp. CCGUVB1N3]MCP3475535.1 hypothetical protein [Bradyrhizobium sp. CCGUVB1N3]
MAFRLPFGTIWFPQPATYQLLAQHPRWSFPEQSPTRTVEVQIAPQLAAFRGTVTAPVQIAVIVAFECPSQPPSLVLRRSIESAEHHRGLSAQHDAVVSISAKLVEGPEFDAADAISEKARLALEEYADVLIHSKPTTLMGVIALSRYVASLPAWLLSDEYDWHQPFLRTLADALDEISVELG